MHQIDAEGTCINAVKHFVELRICGSFLFLCLQEGKNTNRLEDNKNERIAAAHLYKHLIAVLNTDIRNSQ